MKSIDLVKYILGHPEFNVIMIMDKNDDSILFNPMDAINHLGSIDPFNCNTMLFNIDKSIANDILSISTIK